MHVLHCISGYQTTLCNLISVSFIYIVAKMYAILVDIEDISPNTHIKQPRYVLMAALTQYDFAPN